MKIMICKNKYLILIKTNKNFKMKLNYGNNQITMIKMNNQINLNKL